MSNIAGKDHVSIERRPQLSQNVCSSPINTVTETMPCVQENLRIPSDFKNLATPDKISAKPRPTISDNKIIRNSKRFMRLDEAKFSSG